jgi:hypothetical protein
MARQVLATFDWELWFQWIMATTIGWVIGRFLLPNLAIVTIGIALGVMQWLVLQRQLKNAQRWIVATIAGWIFGSILVLGNTPFGLDILASMLIGGTIGISQWIVLRNEIRWSGWWIVMSVVGWTSGLTLLPGFFLTGTIAGLITGTALILLIRYPKKEFVQEY